MNNKRQQDEKLFSHDELNTLLKKMDELELMEKMDKNLGLTKVYNDSKHNRIIGRIKKFIRIK